MAPYIHDGPIEPVDEALEAPLKAKPQLVAPEPGTSGSHRWILLLLTGERTLPRTRI